MNRMPDSKFLRAARARQARIQRLTAFSLVLCLASGAAWAYWSATSIPGGNGASAATSVNQGATPTANAVGSAVTVSWAASTLASGTAVAGYIVKRYDTATTTSQTMLTACTGTVTATTCVENNVPIGSWKYSVTPVVGTNWSGSESLKSTAVTVVSIDITPPVNAVSMSVVTGNAFKTANTIYYGGAASGSFTLTNAVSDAGSGPASSATAALTGTSTGWTHNPSTVSSPTVGPYVSAPFSWAAATTSAPGEVVTGRDVAGNTVTTPLSLVNDSIPPTAGTITYADGYQPGRSVAVTFTTGTDGGSGIATRQLQRSAAPLTGGNCGTFGSFSNLGADSPTSVYTDSQVSNGVCYKYQYIVTDRVGNQHIATTVNVAKVDYAGAVNTTTGLLSQWRLGEAATTLTSSDSFTDVSGDELASHTGEIGATWVHKAGSANAEISDANRMHRAGSMGYTIDYTTATPPTADYSVEADLVVKSNLAGDRIGVIGRMNTTTNTFYMARWEPSDTSWNLVKYTDGAVSYLNYVAGQPALIVNESYRIRLDMAGTALNLYVNGVLKTSATDATITATGKAGIMDGNGPFTGSKSNTTGLHFDNFQVTPATYPRAADGKGSNTGDYENGVTMGTSGALAGDTDTASQFDGINDYVQMTGTSGFPVGASVRSTEIWFKTTSSAKQVLFRYGAGASTQEYGLWINAGGSTMTAWGWGGGNDLAFNMPSAVNNGNWHHVVQTYNGTSITIYIDGVALPSQAATRATTMDMYGFGVGAVIRPSDSNSGGFFTGSLDEVSFYTTALNQATVTNHYQLGTSSAADITGPTGGSVDAGALVGTGSRYATSTTLSLNLAKGTDPSGVAASGAQLVRATGALANGTCGTFGSYALVAGGTDPVSPKVDTVADQACYSYQYFVSDSLGNATTYSSPDIKVDTTVPTTPTLAFSTFSNTYWSTGTTVFYRSAAATGSFTSTGSATDPASGIASYAFPTLGTNWSSTPGALGVNTYSWSSAPAAPGTKNVTAINNAAGTSANAPFTLTADDTAPAAGTVSYLNGTTTSTTVSVSFTTGTDGGSGIGTRLLQRATAPMTGSTCGTFGSFTTVTNGTNPTSPVGDAVTAGNCYKYQYVVADNVGNQHTAASGSVTKASLSYFTTVSGTTNLVSYWRLGEATTVSDTFTGTSGTTLQTHTGEIGATWTRHPVSYADAAITSEGRIRKDGTSWGSIYYSSAVPSSADYTVEADVWVASILPYDLIWIMGRLDTAATTYYSASYDPASQKWNLSRNLNGTGAVLGQSTAQTLTAGTTYRLALDMNGSTIRLLVNGVQQASAVDTTVTAAGRGGIAMGYGAYNTTVADNTGMHLDNFRVTPPLADSKGSNTGDYSGGVTLGSTGAVAGDTDKSALFDGVDDVASVPDSASLKPATSVSVEAWVKPNAGIPNYASVATKTALNSWSDGYGMYAWNGGIDFWVNDDANDVLTAAIPANVWTHVAGTYDGSRIKIYMNGVLADSVAYASPMVHSTAPLLIGDAAGTGNYHWAGGIDEVAVYNRALTATEVAAHYAAR